jgi:hypothetical protein
VSGLRERHFVGGATAACAVCCAAPVIGFLGVAGFAATAVTLAFAGVVSAIVVGLAALVALLVRRSRARRATCAPATTTEPVVLQMRQTRTNDSIRTPRGVRASTRLRPTHSPNGTTGQRHERALRVPSARADLAA